jgi:hypothetical protein
VFVSLFLLSISSPVIKALPRALLRIQLAEKSSIHIQKCVRAWIAKSFVSLYKPLRILACNLIQKIFRSKRERRIANAYRKLIYAASVKVNDIKKTLSFILSFVAVLYSQ